MVEDYRIPHDPHWSMSVKERRTKIAELYTQGWTQMALAEHFGVSQPTICADLKIIRQMWEDSSIRNFDELRHEQIQKLNLLERESWSAWQRSKQPLQEAVIGEDGPRKRSSKRVKNRVGDPKYLDTILKCILSRCSLLGINAETVERAQAMAFNSDRTVEERRQRLLELIDSLKQRAEVQNEPDQERESTNNRASAPPLPAPTDREQVDCSEDTRPWPRSSS